MKAPSIRAPVIGAIGPTTTSEGDVTPQMAKMPWYPRDFASSTRGWPLVARAAYRELLDAQWDMGAVPESSADLCVLVMATPREWITAWRYIEPKFPISSDGRRRNPRLESHRGKAVELVKKQRAGAAATNAKLWGKR